MPTANRSGSRWPPRRRMRPRGRAACPTFPTWTLTRGTRTRRALPHGTAASRMFSATNTPPRASPTRGSRLRALDVERRAAELDVVRDERPEGGDVVLGRPADRAGVDPAVAPELHVRVTRDHEARIDSLQRFREPLRRRSVGEDRPHVAFRAAWQYRPRRARPSAARLATRRSSRRRASTSSTRPAPGRSSRARSPLRPNGRAPRSRRLWAEEEVAAEDDRIDLLPFHVGENRLERNPLPWTS